MPHAVMLFAAGLGTRMAPLTDRLPKPLIAVGGLPLIDHALAQVDAAGVVRIVVNLHYKAGMIRDHLKGRPGILFSDETNELLETGGGVKAALPLLGEDPVYTMNTDAVWSGGNPVTELAQEWDPARMEACLLLVHLDDAVGHLGPGDFDLMDDGRIARGGPYIYTGVQITATGRIAAMTEAKFSLNWVWDQMAAEGRLFGTKHRGGFCDVGRPDAIALAEAHMAEMRHV
ncbi:MAG TPA: nucleotidyltransferase family protein [Albidovulum sp.]|uniref:nucleotidyltransferase family protein n=1 Tax=Albidovulum sp. TaxID=1872424 RepID=UPI002B85DF7D|nr:nucleotidyltransferase family protein [Albidovulum sp.]